MVTTVGKQVLRKEFCEVVDNRLHRAGGEVSVAGVIPPICLLNVAPASLCASLSRCFAGGDLCLLDRVQPICRCRRTSLRVAASSSISLSISTAMLAWACRRAVGRYRPQAGDGHRPAAGRLLSLLSTTMTSWHGIPITRAIGLSLSGVAAVGMTYLSEDHRFRRLSMGLISAATPSAA